MIISSGHSKNNGFTIVELLIVVVVIAILAAITIVSYNGITAQAKDSNIQNDLRNIQQSLQARHAIDGVYASGDAAHSVKDTMDGIVESSFAKLTFNTASYGISDLYPSLPRGTVIVGGYQVNPGPEATMAELCIVAKSGSGQNYLMTTTGVLQKTGAINTLGGAHDFRTTCASEGGVENVGAYGSYQLPN